MTERETHPVDRSGRFNDANRVVVAESWTDPKTGQTYVHKDLVAQKPDWSVEQHIPPMNVTERLGDVASWAEYVSRYANEVSFLSWNSNGLRAVLDYPDGVGDTGRCQWVALFPFTKSREWREWESFGSGHPLTQRQALEKLEDLGEDISAPPQADLLKILRELRANASAKAETVLRPDGTSLIEFSKETSVSPRSGSTEIPAEITAAIPVLAGDTTRWGIRVRVRVSVDENAKLALRFSLINAERVLEAVYAEKVEEAQGLLGDARSILRAAG